MPTISGNDSKKFNKIIEKNNKNTLTKERYNEMVELVDKMQIKDNGNKNS